MSGSRVPGRLALVCGDLSRKSTCHYACNLHIECPVERVAAQLPRTRAR